MYNNQYFNFWGNRLISLPPYYIIYNTFCFSNQYYDSFFNADIYKIYPFKCVYKVNTYEPGDIECIDDCWNLCKPDGMWEKLHNKSDNSDCISCQESFN